MTVTGTDHLATQVYQPLTHWGRVTHICVGNLTIIGPDNGLSPGRHQAIIWTNAGILLIGPLGTNFSEMLIEILTFSFKKMCLKVSSAKWQPFCLGLNVLSSPVTTGQSHNTDVTPPFSLTPHWFYPQVKGTHLRHKYLSQEKNSRQLMVGVTQKLVCPLAEVRPSNKSGEKKK